MNTRKCMPDCTDCKEWPWCSEIPQECVKGVVMIKDVYCWFGDQYIIIPVDNVTEDMTEEDILEAAFIILDSNISLEVPND